MSKIKELCPVCHQKEVQTKYEWNHTYLCSQKCKEEFSSWAQEYDLNELNKE